MSVERLVGTLTVLRISGLGILVTILAIIRARMGRGSARFAAQRLF